MAKRKPLDPRTVLKQIEEAGSDLDLTQLASDLLAAFGGTAGLAQKCIDQFEETTSTTAKGKMLDSVMRMLTIAIPKKDALDALVGADTKDLEATLAKLLGRGAAA